jgi:hypothetical protein
MGSPPFIAVGSKGLLQLHIRKHAHRALIQFVSEPTGARCGETLTHDSWCSQQLLRITEISPNPP